MRVQALNPLSADVEEIEQGEVRGKILLRTMPGSAYAYGDLLSIRGNSRKQARAVRFHTRRICFIRASRRSANTRAWSC